MNSHISRRFAQKPADFAVGFAVPLVAGAVRPQVSFKVSGLSRPNTGNSLAFRLAAHARRVGQTAAIGECCRGEAGKVSVRRTSRRYSFRYPSLGGWAGPIQGQLTRHFSLHHRDFLPRVAGRIVPCALRQPPVIAADLRARQEPEGTPPCSKRS